MHQKYTVRKKKSANCDLISELVGPRSSRVLRGICHLDNTVINGMDVVVLCAHLRPRPLRAAALPRVLLTGEINM